MKKTYEITKIEIIEFNQETIETATVSVGTILPGDEVIDIEGIL